MTQKVFKGLSLRRPWSNGFMPWWKKSRWHKFYVIVALTILVCLGTMYGIGRWYIYTQRNVPYNWGTTFVADYAEYLGLDPYQTLHAILTDFKLGNIRLVTYWSDIEPTQGQYNFTELNLEFQQAQQANVPVILSIGMRQPRWPECHIPTYVENEPSNVWEPQLYSYITQVVNRYKDNPDLQAYELENEYFLKAFGTCANYSRDRLIYEYNLVKTLDPSHPVIISRSNNAIGTPIGQPQPDESGVSIYKRVWDKTITHRYFEYPIPAWYYGFLAGVTKIVSGRNTIIHELQAEPWPPTPMLQASQAEQAKSMNATILKSRFQYGQATGIKTMDLWGSEWWYYEKTIIHNPSDWNVAQQEYNIAAQHNLELAQNQAKAAK